MLNRDVVLRAGPCTTKRVQHTQGILRYPDLLTLTLAFGVSGHTKLVINSLS